MTFVSATCGRGLPRVETPGGSRKRDLAWSVCMTVQQAVLHLPTPPSMFAEPKVLAFAGAGIRQVRASIPRARAGLIRGW